MDHAIITDIGLCIIVAWLLAVGAQLVRQPLILAYLVAGFALGPHSKLGPQGNGFIHSQASIDEISSLGLIFLLFMIGLEIDLKKMANAGRAILVTAGVQIVGGCLLLLAALWALGFAIGNGRLDALYLAIALSLSSTVIIVKILYDKHELDTLAGRITLGVLVLQDLFAILFLAFQPNLQHPQVGPILQSLCKVALLVISSLAASRYVLPHIFHTVARLPELVLVGALAWCFAVAGFAQSLDLSREMGALIAGVAISTFPYTLDVSAKVTSLRDFFVTLFFVALGMTIPRPSIEFAGWTVLLSALLIVSRFVTVLPVLYRLSHGHRVSLTPTINLSQMSEFSLVIVALGAKSAHIQPETTGLAAYVFALLAVLSTYGIDRSDYLVRRLSPLLRRCGWEDLHHEQTGPQDEQTPDIFLLGFFRTASSLLEELRASNPDILTRLAVIDFNPHVNKELRRRGVRIIYGDISQRDTLLHAGVPHAKVLVCTIPNSLLKGTTNLRLLQQLRGINPTAQILTTADTMADAKALYAAGASFVSIPRLTEAKEICAAMEAGQMLDEKREQARADLQQRQEVVP